ncbi:MAG: H(+)/Cl(-) exchange transporter ClcA [Verrucomicrobia subdivision 3 bacterium]|nr:H(+)/Cl(-) exchange transporter ClcA [Limisphaerales bacterium]MCS1414586.1 H(+)/Cl(-) exchange transporter ClcA [Limisphaerales bacterium]
MRQTISRYLRKLPKKTQTIALTCVYGLFAGLAAVLFHLVIQGLFSVTFQRLATLTPQTFAIGSFVIIISSSLAVGFLLTRFCPGASGSGIPQLKLAFWKDFGTVSWQVVWVKFVAGVLSIGGGCSLGREGPSVQLASGVASNLAGVLGEPKQTRRHAAAAGAAAGLAAAFNTPLAAITFVLEEIVQDLNSRILGSILLASVLGALVVHGLVGPQPAFVIDKVNSPDWRVYLLIPVVAAAASLIGILFQKATLALRKKRKRFERIPAWFRPTIGGLVTWVLGVAVFLITSRNGRPGSLGVFSVGYEDLSRALSVLDAIDWRVAGLLLAAKLIATFACYGFGGCGGIFSPTLFLGGMCGVFLTGIFGHWLDLDASAHVLLAIVGMSACLGAVVRAPVTGILIVFEMTHEFSLVPALMLGALISSAISRRLSKENFYEAILLQDGHNLDHVIPPRDLKSWQQLPVSAIANFQVAAATELSPDSLKELLRQYPYKRFPAIKENQLIGILTRKGAEETIQAGKVPHLEESTTCLPTETIKELQFHLIESSTGFVAVLDRKGGNMIGLVTLHDLLRAEVSITKEGSEDC